MIETNEVPFIGLHLVSVGFLCGVPLRIVIEIANNASLNMQSNALENLHTLLAFYKSTREVVFWIPAIRNYLKQLWFAFILSKEIVSYFDRNSVDRRKRDRFRNVNSEKLDEVDKSNKWIFHGYSEQKRIRISDKCCILNGV